MNEQTKIAIEKETEQVIKFAEKYALPTKAIPKIISTHFKNKKWINELLGLNETNNWKIKFKLPTKNSHKIIAQSLTSQIYTATRGKYKPLLPFDPAYMMMGKNKIKIGKIIVETAKDLYRCKYESLLKIMELGKVPFPKTMDDETIKKINCFYGDYIKQGRIGFISTNPLDYFTSSGPGTTFTSCIKVGGGHFNTILMYLNSKTTFILYCCEEANTEKKTGRMWAYINEHAMGVGRSFGAIYPEDEDYFMHTIIKKSALLYQYNDDLRIGNIVTRQTKIGYVDTEYGRVCQIKLQSTVPTEQKIIIPAGICMECGEKLDISSQGYCSGCKNQLMKRSCVRCQKLLTETTRLEIKGLQGYVCQECAGVISRKCDDCGEQSYNERMRRIGVTGNVVCIECISNNPCKYQTCGHCGVIYQAKQIIRIKDTGMCTYCLKDLVSMGKIIKCQDCGEIMFTHNAYKEGKLDTKQYWCKKCYEIHSATTKEKKNQKWSIKKFGNKTIDENLNKTIYNLMQSLME